MNRLLDGAEPGVLTGVGHAMWKLFEDFKAQVEASELATSTKQTYTEHPKRFLAWLETGRIDTSVRP